MTTTGVRVYLTTEDAEALRAEIMDMLDGRENPDPVVDRFLDKLEQALGRTPGGAR